MKKSRILTLMLAMCAILGTASAEEADTVVVGSSTMVSGAFFSDVFGSNSSDIDVRAMIHGYSPVVWTSQTEFEVDPQVVTNLETTSTKKGTQYTVTIAEDLKWNDGTAITAADYVFAYLLQASGEMKEIGADTDQWEYILGYEDYNGGKTDALQGVRLVDDYTFSVTVNKTYEPYITELGYLSTSPYPISVIAPGCEVVDTDKGAMIADAGTDVQTIFTAELLDGTVLNGYLSNPALSCGPYKLTAYDAATGTVDFEINEYYKGSYDGTKPSFEKVELVCIAQGDMVDAFKNGTVDILNKVSSYDNVVALTEAADASGARVMSYSRLGLAFLDLDTSKGPQASQKVRQALACMIDVDQLINDEFGGVGNAVYGYYGLGQWQYQAINGAYAIEGVDATKYSLASLDTYAYDLERAEKLLISDGWTLNENGKKFDKENDTLRYKKVSGKLVPLSFTFLETEGQAQAEYIVNQLSESLKAVGGELKVEKASFNEVLAAHDAEGEKSYDIIFLVNNFVSTQDPYMSLNTGDNQLDKLAKQMHTQSAGDLNKYLQGWIKYQQRYNAVLPTIPLYSGLYYDFCTSEIAGYAIAANTNWPGALLNAEPATEAAETVTTPAA